MRKIIQLEVIEIVNVSGKKITIIKRERALKNLLAKMIGELYCPQFQSNIYDAADIPTRETVDQYLPKIIDLFVK